MDNIQELARQDLEQAISIIDENPDLRKGRDSLSYDLIHNNKKYPPVLVLSEANKLAGGNELTLEDFGNSTKKAFKILSDLGFQVELKSVSTDSYNNAKFIYADFYKDATNVGLNIQNKLALRFIASLLTKPFTILTGLSGSGKTQLAILFTKWLTHNSLKKRSDYSFNIDDEVKSNRVTYKVTGSDKQSVTFTQTESGTKATLPYELIHEWIDTIKEFNFTKKTSPRLIREKVEEKTKFSLQLNSFETHLKAGAFFLIDTTNNISQKNDPQICIVPIGADWTNREPLLGFPNALEKGKYVKPDNGALDLLIAANNNPDLPHFLILDEMNLSHVERYFADFLSVMESKEKISLHAGPGDWDGIPPEISFPENLFVIGTVNIDETTYMFSPKVLDRANVIEFRVTAEEMRSYLKTASKLNTNGIKGKGTSMAKNFLEIAKDNSLQPKNIDEINDALMSFFTELKKTGAEFGYRSASEIRRFAAIINKLEPDWSDSEIIDAALMQKLLPKVHGSRKKLEPVLKTLGTLCLPPGQLFEEYLKNPGSVAGKYPVSAEKIARMYNNLLSNGFTSYAEA